jgi:GH43 family beta-xylosidase
MRRRTARGAASDSSRRVPAAQLVQAALAIGGAGALAIGAGPLSPAAGTPLAAVSGAPQLVVNRDFPDPGVVQTAGGDYAYSSNGYYDGKLINVPEAQSATLTGPWTATGVDALPDLPGWVSFDPSSNTDDVWSPDVSRLDDGDYILYYTAHDANGLQCIGAATATTSAGPFVPVGTQPLICNSGDHGDIDPTAYTENGHHYLIYKDNANSAGIPDSIWINEVAANGINWIGDRDKLLTAAAAGDENNVAEAASLIKQDGRYVLFYSADNWNSTYHVKYAVSDTLTGTYTKQGTTLDTATWDGAIIAPGGDYVTTGPDGTEYMFFHGNISSGRGLYADQLNWAHGVPQLAGAPVLANGTYEFSALNGGNSLADEASGSDPGKVGVQAAQDNGIQQWNISVQADGSCLITSAGSGLALSVLGSSASSPVGQAPYTGSTRQLWYIDRDFNGYFRITSAATGALLTVNGLNVSTSANDDSASQKWLPAPS